MRTIIIDDEKDGRGVLEKMLRGFSNIDLVGQADSVDTGFKLIQKTKPDLVFLDIEMSGGYGFDLLEKFENIDFRFVFVTAFDQYAIKAIKFNALDYVLKPVDPDELKRVVQKAGSGAAIGSYNYLLRHVRNHGNFTKIAIPSVSSIRYVGLEDIIRFNADGNYTHVFLTDGSRLTTTRLLKEFEELVDGYGFLRIHRSHVVNLYYIKEFKRSRKDIAVLKDGTEIEISRQRRALFLEAMNNL